MTESTIISLILGILGVLCAVIGALLLIGINKTLGEMKTVWEEIKKIEDKQATLRAQLPEEYLRYKGPGYNAIIESLTRIEKHSENVAAELRRQQELVAAELKKRQELTDNK